MTSVWRSSKYILPFFSFHDEYWEMHNTHACMMLFFVLFLFSRSTMTFHRLLDWKRVFTSKYWFFLLVISSIVVRLLAPLVLHNHHHRNMEEFIVRFQYSFKLQKRVFLLCIHNKQILYIILTMIESNMRLVGWLVRT